MHEVYKLLYRDEFMNMITWSSLHKTPTSSVYLCETDTQTIVFPVSIRASLPVFIFPSFYDALEFWGREPSWDMFRCTTPEYTPVEHALSIGALVSGVVSHENISSFWVNAAGRGKIYETVQRMQTPKGTAVCTELTFLERLPQEDVFKHYARRDIYA